MTIRSKIEECLKSGWRSNLEMIQYVNSAGAGSIARKIRQNPPDGYVWRQRPRRYEGYRDCLEFRLIKEGQQSLFNN